MKKKILFVNKEQFGLLTDSTKYCEYLSNSYDITYICFDDGHDKVEIDNIRYVYLTEDNHWRSVFLLRAPCHSEWMIQRLSWS